MPPLTLRPVQDGPLAIEEVIAAYPSIRQSLAAKFDDCPLSTLFELKYARGWNTHPQAQGTIFHRFAAMFLRELQFAQKRTMPVQLAEQLLVQACRQHDVPAEEIVRVPMREMPQLRMAARKFAKDNEFSFERIVEIEKRMSATITYPHPDGGLVRRTLTGQLDALLEDREHHDGAIVLDWKSTWALPPEPKERGADEYVGEDDELRGLSYHGYFQQRFYAWLVMQNFPEVKRVTLREFYVRKTKARKATITRDRLPEVEEELSILVEAFDRAIGEGAPARPYVIEEMGSWKPQPGRHCGFCAASRMCPVEEDIRIEAGGAITTFERAKAAAAELQVVERVRKVLTDALKGYVEMGGAPVPIKGGKGRRVLGWYTTKRGRRFGLFTPDDSDRGGHAEDLDAQLAAAMVEATERARAERPKRRRRKPGKV